MRLILTWTNSKKKCLLEGLDDIALSLEKSEKIVSFEKKLEKLKPWIFND